MQILAATSFSGRRKLTVHCRRRMSKTQGERPVLRQLLKTAQLMVQGGLSETTRRQGNRNDICHRAAGPASPLGLSQRLRFVCTARTADQGRLESVLGWLVSRRRVP